MHLTRHTDYSLRVLMYLAMKGEQSSTIQEIADRYQISKNHLMKVVHNLSQIGYVASTRGRSGGLLLAKKPSEINLGDVIREVGEEFNIVDCFEADGGTCAIRRACKLKHIINEALFAFLNVLDKYTLADLATPHSSLMKLLSLPEQTDNP